MGLKWVTGPLCLPPTSFSSRLRCVAGESKLSLMVVGAEVGELISSFCAEQMSKGLSYSLQSCSCMHPHMQLDTTEFCKHLATDLLHWLFLYKY